ncbi:hypothetical protein [Halovivax cerinus]|uniref:Small CPxCG-related zinc finger protein n=1 Tax=Halovivax cerinus TaxID=1487865 RepID=A0ABD5NR49_9EURY|nr:hypothetical protein [Halovivax cerinus]
MKSIEATSGARETTQLRECYRCDRDVGPAELFRIDVAPPAMLEARYADSVRYCCEHCAAAMNLSEFSEWVKTGARQEQPRSHRERPR